MPRWHELQPMHEAQRCLSRRLLLSLSVIVQVTYPRPKMTAADMRGCYTRSVVSYCDVLLLREALKKY